MVIYILSQQVDLATNRTEWIDLETSQYVDHLIEYAKKIKLSNPKAVLGLRKVEETEIELKF